MDFKTRELTLGEYRIVSFLASSFHFLSSPQITLLVYSNPSVIFNRSFLLGVDVQKIRNNQKAQAQKNDIAPSLRRNASEPTESSEPPNEKTVSHSKKLDDLEQLEPHKDERQVGLDTERSFVLYSVGNYVFLFLLFYYV